MGCRTCEENARKANQRVGVTYGVLDNATKQLTANAEKYATQRQEQYIQKLEELNTIRSLGIKK